MADPNAEGTSGMADPNDLPKHDQLADETDELGWDRELHGTFADAAAPDYAVPTSPYVPKEVTDAVHDRP